MTQEEYEAKVQSMPKELQNQFRQSLEINLSKRIVNRLMSTVMQAYARGQRNAQKESHDGGYMRGAQDMKDALKCVVDMDMDEAEKYFGIKLCDNRYVRLLHVLGINENDIFDGVAKYRSDKEHEKEENVKNNVKIIADTIGIEKLCEIADEIRKQKAAEGECLPF
jgi:hypothetical protein